MRRQYPSAANRFLPRRLPTTALILLVVLTVADAQSARPNAETMRQYRAAEANASRLVQNDSEQGLKARQDLLAWTIRLFGPTHDMTAVAEHNLGVAYDKVKQYGEAAIHFKRALELHIKHHGMRHPNVGRTMMAAASTEVDLGHYVAAEKMYLAVRDIFDALNDASGRSMINFNLALLYQNQRRFPESLKLFLQERDNRLRTLGPARWGTANIESQIAETYWTMGRYQDGEAMARSAIARSVQISGKPLPGYFQVLALNLNGQGRHDEAWDAIMTYFRDLEQSRPWVLETEAGFYSLGIVGATCAYRGAKCPNAADYMERSIRVQRRSNARMLANLAEPEQLSYLQTVRQDLQDALSLAVVNPDDAALTERSAGWMLNSKATLHESMAQRAVLLRSSTDPQLRPIVDQLRRVRQRISALVNSDPKEGNTLARELQSLQQQEADLSRQLAQAGGRRSVETPWFEVGRLRAALPADAVLVDFAKLAVRNYRVKGAAAEPRDRYVAWIVPPPGAGARVRVIDLGDAAPIDAAVKGFQSGMTAMLKELDSAAERRLRELPVEIERTQEQSFRKTSAALRRLVLDPLLPALGAAKHWIVSPDANLWAIPWTTLWMENTGRYVIEDRSVSYVVSGRDLLEPSPKVATTAPVVFANPDYDLGVVEARRQTAAALGTRAAASRAAAARPAYGPMTVDPLRETATEAQLISGALQTWTGLQPVLYQEGRALEGVAKAVRSPRVIYLATHGFFRDFKIDEKSYLTGSSLLENPLLRCGVLLASCNRREPRAADDDDGVLTGLEVVGMDLRGTELAVLSACETGLGDVWAGQSAAGLRQAFQLAGARSVVASLWAVPNAETVDVMNFFFRQLAARQSRSMALNGAGRSLLEARRRVRGVAHPFFWGAFTLTGQFQ